VAESKTANKAHDKPVQPYSVGALMSGCAPLQNLCPLGSLRTRVVKGRTLAESAGGVRMP
jgi:hypothetical protein